jgi:hypothetical protein
MRKADGAPLLKAAQAPQCLREFSQVLDAASQVGAARATEQHAKQVTQKTENLFSCCTAAASTLRFQQRAAFYSEAISLTLFLCRPIWRSFWRTSAPACVTSTESRKRTAWSTCAALQKAFTT